MQEDRVQLYCINKGGFHSMSECNRLLSLLHLRRRLLQGVSVQCRFCTHAVSLFQPRIVALASAHCRFCTWRVAYSRVCVQFGHLRSIAVGLHASPTKWDMRCALAPTTRGIALHLLHHQLQRIVCAVLSPPRRNL